MPYTWNSWSQHVIYSQYCESAYLSSKGEVKVAVRHRGMLSKIPAEWLRADAQVGPILPFSWLKRPVKFSPPWEGQHSWLLGDRINIKLYLRYKLQNRQECLDKTWMLIVTLNTVNLRTPEGKMSLIHSLNIAWVPSRCQVLDWAFLGTCPSV